VQVALRAAIAAGLVEAAHDSSDGGLLVALAEMAMAAAGGASIQLSASPLPLQRLLFAEGGSRVVVAAAGDDAAPLLALLADHGCPVETLGSSSDDGRLRLQLGTGDPLDWSVEELRRVYEGALPRRLGAPGGGAQ
jgi:phosphoribosylformylglycinamidine synthase